MFECVILGDSIAVGVAQQARDCQAISRIGVSSQTFSQEYRTLPQGNKTLISLGSNDGTSTFVLIYSSLREVRTRIRHGQVTWLLSSNNERAALAADRLAREFGDRIIHVRQRVSSDGVHPNGRGYNAIAQDWLR